jgi:single-stranded DNA-binding protein
MVNSVRLIGYAGFDAKMYDERAFVSIATTQQFRTKEGIIEKTYWHPCTGWGDISKRMAGIKKGDKVLIDGSLSYWDKEISPEITQTNVSINVDFVAIMEKKNEQAVEQDIEQLFKNKGKVDHKEVNVTTAKDNDLPMPGLDDIPF